MDRPERSLERGGVANDERVFGGQFLAGPGAGGEAEAVRLSGERRQQEDEEERGAHTFHLSDVLNRSLRECLKHFQVEMVFRAL